MNDSEKNFALRQGHEIAAEDGYFDARPQIDSMERRKVFAAGFERGWEAALAAAPAQPYDQAVMELCEVCGWKALIPSDECLNCNRDAHMRELAAYRLTVENLEREIAALRKDAELGIVAMRFVDRAGDPHPGIDDAETICREFYVAMGVSLAGTAPMSQECGNCFEGKSDMDHDCPKCGGTSVASKEYAELPRPKFVMTEEGKLVISLTDYEALMLAFADATHALRAARAPADSVLEDAARWERERICAAIKAEDDYCVDQGDYMLDSDDCIKIVRGEWVRPDFSIDAAMAAKQGANHD